MDPVKDQIFFDGINELNKDFPKKLKTELFQKLIHELSERQKELNLEIKQHKPFCIEDKIHSYSFALTGFSRINCGLFPNTQQAL